MDEAKAARRSIGLEAWLVLCLLCGALLTASGIADLHTNWGIDGKDRDFHFAGLAEIGSALLLFGCIWLIVIARNRPGARRHLVATAALVTILAIGSAITGIALSEHAASICACDGA